MNSNHKPVSALVETSRRIHRIVAGTLVLAATLLPAGAYGMDSSLGKAAGQAGQLLPLSPIPYLDSMRWMSWKQDAPLFKVDTLLLPDGHEPGVYRLPAQYETYLPRVS